MASVLLSNDLLFASKIDSCCTQHGWQLKTVRDMEDLMNEASGASVALIDLSYPQLDITSTVERLRDLPEPPRTIVAFGPHVHSAKLEAAKATGCDHVYTRGQLNAQMNPILGALIG